jgi:hypothetical protein
MKYGFKIKKRNGPKQTYIMDKKGRGSFPKPELPLRLIFDVHEPVFVTGPFLPEPAVGKVRPELVAEEVRPVEQALQNQQEEFPPMPS